MHGGADGRKLQRTFQRDSFERSCGEFHGDGDDFGVGRGDAVGTIGTERPSSSAIVSRSQCDAFGVACFAVAAWRNDAAAAQALGDERDGLLAAVRQYRNRRLRWGRGKRGTRSDDCGDTFGDLHDYSDADGDVFGYFEAVSTYGGFVDVDCEVGNGRLPVPG